MRLSKASYVWVIVLKVVTSRRRLASLLRLDMPCQHFELYRNTLDCINQMLYVIYDDDVCTWRSEFCISFLSTSFDRHGMPSSASYLSWSISTGLYNVKALSNVTLEVVPTCLATNLLEMSLVCCTDSTRWIVFGAGEGKPPGSLLQ